VCLANCWFVCDRPGKGKPPKKKFIFSFGTPQKTLGPPPPPALQWALWGTYFRAKSCKCPFVISPGYPGKGLDPPPPPPNGQCPNELLYFLIGASLTRDCVIQIKHLLETYNYNFIFVKQIKQIFNFILTWRDNNSLSCLNTELLSWCNCMKRAKQIKQKNNLIATSATLYSSNETHLIHTWRGIV